MRVITSVHCRAWCWHEKPGPGGWVTTGISWILGFVEGSNRTTGQLSWILYWILVPFILVGAVVLARTSWRQLTIVAVPIVVVAIDVAITYGSTRFRVAAEPSLAVLAAGGIAAVARRFRLGIIGRQAPPILRVSAK